MPPELQLLGGAWPEEPGLDTALSKIILDRVSAGDMPATMRLYVPGREVAFGRRDAVTPQYPAAVAAAAEVGFAAVERLAGGRAAVFTEQTIAFALALPDDDPFAGLSGTLLGLWYTGKSEFVVGVEGGLMSLPVANRTVDEVDSLFGIITIKYYF